MRLLPTLQLVWASHCNRQCVSMLEDHLVDLGKDSSRTGYRTLAAKNGTNTLWGGLWATVLKVVNKNKWRRLLLTKIQRIQSAIK